MSDVLNKTAFKARKSFRSHAEWWVRISPFFSSRSILPRVGESHISLQVRPVGDEYCNIRLMLLFCALTYLSPFWEITKHAENGNYRNHCLSLALHVPDHRPSLAPGNREWSAVSGERFRKCAPKRATAHGIIRVVRTTLNSTGQIWAGNMPYPFCRAAFHLSRIFR